MDVARFSRGVVEVGFEKLVGLQQIEMSMKETSGSCNRVRKGGEVGKVQSSVGSKEWYSGMVHGFHIGKQ